MKKMQLILMFIWTRAVECVLTVRDLCVKRMQRSNEVWLNLY